MAPVINPEAGIQFSLTDSGLKGSDTEEWKKNKAENS
jgi:hypothetical protein